MYEQPELQKLALSIIPVTELKRKARKASGKNKEGGEGWIDEEDCLLFELSSWFKGKRSLERERERGREGGREREQSCAEWSRVE